MSQPIRGRDDYHGISIGSKNPNLVEDVVFLFPVKFCQILLGRFRGEVKTASANQRSEQQSFFFSMGLKNANLVKDVEFLLPVQYCQIPFSSFRGEMENV